jgi:hypothetical protein
MHISMLCEMLQACNCMLNKTADDMSQLQCGVNLAAPDKGKSSDTTTYTVNKGALPVCQAMWAQEGTTNLSTT